MFMLRPIYVEEVILKDIADKKLWVALTTVSGLIFEFILLFVGKNLLLRVEKSKLMAFALLTVSIRVWAHYFVPEDNRNWIFFLIAVESLRGMHIGALQGLNNVNVYILVAGVQLSAEAAGPVPSLRNTAQGIFFAVVCFVLLTRRIWAFLELSDRWVVDLS
jgi:hypothetical protein